MAFFSLREDALLLVALTRQQALGKKSSENDCLCNLLGELPGVDEPTYKLETTMSCQCPLSLALIAVTAQLAQAIHLDLCKATLTQKLTIFFAVHVKLLL